MLSNMCQRSGRSGAIGVGGVDCAYKDGDTHAYRLRPLSDVQTIRDVLRIRRRIEFFIQIKESR